MSTDNFGSLGADFFIKTYNKGSTMSQADLDALVQYVQLTTTILAIGDFTPDQQDSVWMILERTDVNTAPGYTVTNNTDVTMTSGGLVTINSLPWSKITGKPSFFSGSYNDLTDKPTIPGEVDIGDFIFSAGDASLPASNTMTLSTFRNGANEESRLTLSPTTESSLYAAGVLKLGTGYGSGSEQYWQFGANGVLTIPGSGDIVQNGVSVLGGSTFSGSYNDLTDKPSIPNLTGYATESWVNSQGFGSGSSGVSLPANASGYLTNDGSGNLSWAAGDGTFSGDYNDLTNKPTIPTATSNLTNDSGFITSNVSESIVPTTDNAIDLGSPTNRFRHLYVAPGTIYLGDIKLTNLNGKLDAKKVINAGEDDEYEDETDSDAFSPLRGGGATSLEDLEDVNLEGPVEGSVLTWSEDDEKWVNRTPSTTEFIAGEGIAITTSNNQVTISAASNASPQYGYFTELSNTADSNRVNGEAVAMDNEGNSYVSYSYYSDNDDRNYGGVAKFSSTGTKLWSVDISSQNGDAQYPEICSLEYSTLNGSPVLIAFGNYYDNNTSKDVAIMYAINPETGAVGLPLLDAEITSDFGMELKDGVVGVDGNNDPFAVVVGSTYDQKLTKTLTPLAGSTVDKVYFSWSDVNAAGLQNNDQLIYNVGGYAGLRVNAVETTANPAGSTDPSWYGLSLTISATESGSYVITRVNGWGGAINSWPAPQTLTVLGSVLGGVDGVNDMTFDFDNTVFNNDSNNITAAVSNIQGTPVSNVYCQAWNGKDWSTEIGNPLTFDYNLNNQAFIARFGSNAWTKNVGTTDYDRLNSVAVDSDGNVYAAGYAWNNSRGSLVAKYDVDGVKQWTVYIDPSNNTGNELTSIDLLPDGDIITVDEEGTVTKLNKTDGSIIWQISVSDGPSWDGNFRGTATPDGDYILANHEDNDYTLYVMRVSGSDGSNVWTKRITRTYGGSNGEINVEDDFDAQFIDCNDTYVTIAANSQPNSGNETGLVISFPINGENVNGTYGQYIITSESLDWTTESTGSITATVTETPTNVTVNEISPSKTDSTFTVNKTNIGGEEVVAAEVITWTNPNNNTWRIETYNGGAAVQYWSGDDQSAKWFDIADHTSGSSDFRGAIIQYHAFIQNRGTIIGTIHLTNDYTQEEATHTEHLSGGSDLQFVTLWKCNNERGQLFFKMTNEQNWQAMIQWTSTVFYGQEFND